MQGVAAEMLRESVARRNKPSVIDSKRTILNRHILPIVGGLAPHEVNQTHVIRLQQQLRHLSPKTVNNVLCVFRRTLDMARQLGHQTARIELRALPNREAEARWLSFSELGRLIDGASQVSPECLAMVLLGSKAGLRRGEMVALKWSDVMLDARKLTVRRSSYKDTETAPKSGRFRTVPLSGRLEVALAMLDRPTEYVLTRTLQARGLAGRRAPDLKASPETIRRWLDLACEAARMPHIGVHTLRHTFCSHLAQRGVSLVLIQRLAGHSDPKTTQRYVHLADEQLSSAVDLI
jgi:integrase